MTCSADGFCRPGDSIGACLARDGGAADAAAHDGPSAVIDGAPVADADGVDGSSGAVDAATGPADAATGPPDAAPSPPDAAVPDAMSIPDATPPPDAAWPWDGTYSITVLTASPSSCYMSAQIQVSSVDGDGAGSATWTFSFGTYVGSATVVGPATLRFGSITTPPSTIWMTWDGTRTGMSTIEGTVVTSGGCTFDLLLTRTSG